MACAVDHVRGNHGSLSTGRTVSFKSFLENVRVSKYFDRIHEKLVKQNRTTSGSCESNLVPHQLDFNRRSFRVHRITPETHHNLSSFDGILRDLEQAMDLYESDNVLQARKAQQRVFKTVLSLQHPEDHFKPTKLGWRVMERGKESFLKNAISSCLLHGTILLDTSDSAAQFYPKFLNVLGAFAVETSDFRIASETFKLSADIYQKSGYTSRSRDLGVAYNNMGCIATIMGDFMNAEKYLTESVKHLEDARKTSHAPQSEDIEVQVLAVQNNIGRLCMLERNHETAFRLLAPLVDLCKGGTKRMLPIRTVLVVILNQTMLHVTLRNFKMAEIELEWLKSLYGQVHERNDLLVKYISLHLCDVKFLRGKEVEDIFDLDALNCASVRQFLFLNGNMHDNLTVATLERLADLLVHKGKLSVANMILEESVQNCKDIFGQTHFHVASLLCKQASVLHLMGDTATSIENFKNALSIWLEIFDFNHPVIMRCHAAIADMLAFKGIKDESHLYCERTVENIEAIYEVSFSNQLSVKFSEMMTNQRRMPFVTTKQGSAEDIKIQGLVVEFGAQLALITSFRHPSTKNRKQDWKPYDRGRDEKRLKEPFPPHAITRWLHLQCSVSSRKNYLLVIPKFTYDLSQSGQRLARCGMIKESAAFLQTANLFCEKFADSHDYKELLRTLLCCRNNQTSKEDALFPKTKDIVYRCLNEMKDCAKAKEPNGGLGTCREDVEQSLRDSQLKLKPLILFVIKASIEMNILDATFEAYDLYSSVFPDNGDFIRVCDGLQIFASRTRMVCNGKNATHDILILNSVAPTGQDNETRGSDPSPFKTLAYKTGAPSDGFLVFARANSFIDIEHFEQLKLRSLRSVEELFKRTCFENENRDKPMRFLVELNVSFSAESVPSSIVTDMDLLALCFLKTFPEARETIFEISAEKTCDMLTCLNFSDSQTSSFLFVKALQYLLQHCPGTEIDTVSIRNEGVILSFFKPAKARLTVWCEDKNMKQRTQVLSTTHRIVGNERCCNASTRTFGPCSCNHIAGLFLQAVEHCSSVYNVAYETVVVKKMCTSLSGLGERSLVDFGLTSEPQSRSGRPYVYCEQTLVREQSQHLRDFIQKSLFNILDANSTISGILDKEVPPRSEVSSFDRSHHDNNDVDDLTSLLRQRDMKAVASARSTPSQFQAFGDSFVLESALFLKERQEERRYGNETDYGRWRFEEDQKLRRFQVAECQRELERKRSEKSQSFVVSQEGQTIKTTNNKIAEFLDKTSEALQSERLALQERGTNGYSQSHADSFGKPTNHTSAPEGKVENEASTKESPNAGAVKDNAMCDKRVNGYNGTLEEHSSNEKNITVSPCSSNIDETSGEKENQYCKETSMDVFPSSTKIETSRCQDQLCNVTSPGCPDPFNQEFTSSDLKIAHASDPEKNEKMMKTECALLKEGFVECKLLPDIAGVARYPGELLSNGNERSAEGETRTSMGEVISDRDTAPADVTRVSASVEGRVGKRNADESEKGDGDPLAKEENGLFKLQSGKAVDTSDEAREETLPECDCLQNPKIASHVESSFERSDVINDGVCEGGDDSNTASVLLNQNAVNGNDPQWEKTQSSNEQIEPRHDHTNYEQAVSRNSSSEGVEIGEENSTSTALELSLMHGNGCQGDSFREEVSDLRLLASHDVCVVPVQQLEINEAGGRNVSSTQARRIWSEQGSVKRNASKEINDNTFASAGTAGGKNSQIDEETLVKVSKQREISECRYPKSVSKSPFQGADVIADSAYEDVSSYCSNKEVVSDLKLLSSHDVCVVPVQQLEINEAGGRNVSSTQARRIWSEQGSVKENATKEIHDNTFASAGKAGGNNSQIDEEILVEVSKQKDISECRYPKPVSRSPFGGGDVIADSLSAYEDVSSYCSNTSPILSSSANDDVIDGPAQRHGFHSNQKEIGQLTYFGNGKNPDVLSNKETKCNTYSFQSLGIDKGNTAQTKLNSSDTWKVRGTRPKVRAQTKMPVPNLSQQYEGIDPGFLARHNTASEDMTCFFTPSIETWKCNSAEYSTVDGTGTRNAEHSNILNRLHEMDYSHRPLDKDFHLGKERDLKYIPIGPGFRGITSHENSAKLQTVDQVLPANGKESWHFPSHPSKKCLQRQNDYDDTQHPGILQARHISYWENSSDSAYRQIAPNSEGIYEDVSFRHLGERFSSMIEQNNSFSETLTESVTSRASDVSQFNLNSDLISTHDPQLSLLKEVISKTVELASLKERLTKDLQRNKKEAVQRRGIEQLTEETVIKERDELKTLERDELNKKDQLQRMEMQSLSSPVQETPPYACGHYQRRCKVQFPCCNTFYPCHRCHNESGACSEDKAKAVHATHLKCTVCHHKQEIDEGGQWCRGCDLKMADYFCAICKHFTSLEKNPFHCEKCGICRIHKERSFHCDVCNVCLDKRLQGKHKCRPDSGHDECCICLEDAFGGCQILPCSHKVHKDCAVAMVQNGVRTCPICRHPLSIPLQDGAQ